MSVAVTIKDSQDLRKLIPLNILSTDRFERLCGELQVEEAPRGSTLFAKGDTKNEFVYVLRGTVSLQADGMEMETISGGTESARFALAHQIPRKVSAVAKDRVRFIRVDSDYVNQPSDKADSGGAVANYEVSEVPREGNDDWVATLLNSPIFQRLSAASLQNILRNLEEVDVKAGQQIVHQDEPGDYYYVIKQGRCALSRKPTKNSRDIKLAELRTCDTFGEDSLISDQPRNVTVTMLTNGVLLRLSKENFLRLVKDPVISYVDFDSAQKRIADGAVWLDVRPQDEFDADHLPGAINIPFFVLRMELANLQRGPDYILVCGNGKISEAAAFLLIRNAFGALVLKGGLSGLAGKAAAGGQVAAHARRAKPVVDDLPPQESMEPDRFAAGDVAAVQAVSEDMGPSEARAFTPTSAAPELADALAKVAVLEAELQFALAEKAQLLGELKAAKGISTQAEPEAASELAAKLQASERERMRDDARIKELEAQVLELSAVVQEFVSDQQPDDESAALHAELETVRGQATADVMAMQTRLRTAEQEVARLKSELAQAYARELGMQAAGHSTAPTQTLPGIGVRLVIALVLVALGAGLVLAGLFGTDAGRRWATEVVAPSVQSGVEPGQ